MIGKRRYALGLALWLLVYGLGISECLAATIGNVTSWTTAAQDITFQIDDGSKVRITILAADTARIRVAPNGTFTANVSRAVINTSWAPAAFTTTDGGSSVTISTGSMKLIILKSPFVLECRDPSNNLVLTDDPSRRIQWDSGCTRVYKSTQSGESYLGLGWRPSGGLRRNGTRFVMRNHPSYGDPTTFYGGIPIWYGSQGGECYGVFFDDTSWGEINVGQLSTEYAFFENQGGMVDYYYFAGPSMAAILDRYTELTGRPFMPPRWACGYQQSRWSYAPQSEVLSIAGEFRARQIPCDVIYLDVDYMDPDHYQLSFNPATFPDPTAMCTTLHAQGFRTIANVENFLVEGSTKWNQADSNGYLLTQAGSAYRGWYSYAFFVMGTPTGWVSWVDLTNPAARTWFEGRHTPFLDHGIDGIWNDKDEPEELGETWPTDVTYDNEGSPASHSVMGTQFCLFQTQFSYDTLRNHYPGKRPFVLSRAAYAGIQRSSAVWSGDNTSQWSHAQLNIPMGLAMSISGQPHNGHDIGGFFNNPPGSENPISSELYARWMQWGVFSAFCRQHHYGYGNHGNCPYVEPWEFGTTVENICRDYIGLRYRLMPYLYTLFRKAHATGEPVQRPTLYDFPQDAATLTQDYAFMFGPMMLVSPVTTAGATTWNTYLPAGSEWINWWDDTLYSGGQTVNTPTPLEQMPIFVRAGAIIPMAPVSQYDGQAPLDVLTLELYPTGQTSEFELYEDDGLSWDYLSGAYCKTHYQMSGTGNAFAMGIGARQGSFVPTPRKYLLKIHRRPGGTNAPCVDGERLPGYPTQPAFDAAESGYFIDSAASIMQIKFVDSGLAMSVTLCAPSVPIVPGDFNVDGDVDQEDYGRFQACISGNGIPQTDPNCAPAKLDIDDDVDQSDMESFLGCLSGPDAFGDPECLP